MNSITDAKLKRIRKDALTKHNRELARAGIPCEQSDTTLKGSCNGEPFAVFMKFVEGGGEWMGVIVTRFKGKDRIGKVPAEILRLESSPVTLS